MTRSKADLVSYRTLRRVVGYLGIALPFVLWLGCKLLDGDHHVLPSISAYAGSDMKNVLTGVLFAVALFLWAYEGYDWRDEWAGNIGCVGLIGVALFPITSEPTWVHVVHYISAGLAFATFAVFAGYLFRLGDKPFSDEKRLRNGFYAGCCFVIVACLAGIVLAQFVFHAPRFVFWLEAIALVAFGFSWLLKGEKFLTSK